MGAFKDKGKRIVAAGALQMDGTATPLAKRAEPCQIHAFDPMHVALASCEPLHAPLVGPRVSSLTRLSGAIVLLKAFSHADDLVNSIAQTLIKLDCPFVFLPDLQVHLRTSRFPQEALRCLHHHPAESFTLVLRSHSEIIDPTTMALIPNHDRRNHLPIKVSDKEKVGAHVELTPDVLPWVIPRSSEFATPPQSDHSSFIPAFKRANLHHKISIGLTIDALAISPDHAIGEGFRAVLPDACSQRPPGATTEAV